jgi:tetratricopeptide (TPR) repeat protein
MGMMAEKPSTGRDAALPVSPAWPVLTAVMLFPPVLALAQDVVHVANSSSAQGYVEWRGEVIDYTGRELRLELPGGTERSFPADAVLRVETQHGPQHAEADQRFAAGDFDGALALYGEARKREPRPWVRREITARIVWCYRALGQPEWAGREFLDVLILADPDTPYFACIPLAWVPSQPSMALERTAREWLGREDVPAAVLLGASHLMSTGSRPEALERLNRLATGPDPRIALLAHAQTWRAAVVTADERQLDGWRATIERMPEGLRAGPYYVLGLAEAHRDRWEAAALAWLRVPILHPEHRRLAARSLLDAGRSLERLGRANQAAGLYRELAATYPQTPAEAEAGARLQELQEMNEARE